MPRVQGLRKLPHLSDLPYTCLILKNPQPPEAKLGVIYMSAISERFQVSASNEPTPERCRTSASSRAWAGPTVKLAVRRPVTATEHCDPARPILHPGMPLAGGDSNFHYRAAPESGQASTPVRLIPNPQTQPIRTGSDPQASHPRNAPPPRRKYAKTKGAKGRKI